MSIAVRYTMALSMMHIPARAQVLEIGCGTGILAGEIARMLEYPGHIRATDRSASMTEKALKRNAAYIQKDIMHVECIAFEDIPPENLYDVVVAYNVNLFLEGEPAPWQKLKDLVKPGGRVCLFFEPPYEAADTFIQPVLQSAADAGFSGAELTRFRPGKVQAFCVQVPV
ncbi:MAG: class I SAM-dependent methyltransferase [Flavobacteriales bacterium]